MSLNIDLHSHSTVSDGELTPTDVVTRAHAKGVDVYALTDHDEVGGLAEASQAASRLGLRFVPGVEISVTWAGQTVHIVGLKIDADNPTLLQGLAATRSGRLERARRMGERLASLGIPDVFEGALRLAGNPALVSRTHFARHLVDIGACETIGEVFDRYLAPGKPGYEPTEWAKLQDAVDWIKAAGGLAVIAHPGRYHYSDTASHAFYETFRDMGGVGMEVVTGSHTPDQYSLFANIAQRYGFLASRGSDFHAPRESRIDLGQLPDLPAYLTPVWHDWF